MPEGDPVDELEGHYWIDSDNDCQNTRHELLLRESLEPVTFSTTSQCRVLTGKWYGQYLGVFFTEASDLDLDHIIPLKWAHEHGGWRWSAEDKQQFANDYQNLILVDDGRNQSKGAKGPGEWMPDNAVYHYMYVFRWTYLIESIHPADQRKVIAMFDHDQEGINTYSKLSKNFSEADEKSWFKKHKNGYSSASTLGAPDPDSSYVSSSNLCIEFLFADEYLEQCDQDGHKLVLEQPSVNVGIGKNRRKVTTDELPGIADMFGDLKFYRRVIGGKKTFAENIIPTFGPEAFSNFNPLFEFILNTIEQ